MLSYRRVIAIAGCLSAAVWALVTWLSHGIGERSGFHYETSNDAMPTGLWLALHFCACGLLVISLVTLRRHRNKGSLRRRDSKRLGLHIIGFAILFRIILLPGIPIHESDFYRYLWDGQTSAAGINPYEFEPGALYLFENDITEWFRDANVEGVIWKGRGFSAAEIERLKKLRDLRDANTDLLERVGHPAVPTIYPPVAQGVFWCSVSLFGPSILGLKVLLLCFEIGIICLVYRLLQRFHLPMEGLLVYAWNPLVLKEFANSAHYDVVPIFFTLLAVWAAIRPVKTRTQATAIAPAIALAAGTLSKFFSLLLMPILVSPRWKNALPYTVFGAVLLIAYLPFFFWDQVGLHKVFAGLGVYNANWEYGSFLFPLIHHLLALSVDIDSAWILAKFVVASLLIAVIAWLTFVRPARTPLRKVYHCALCIGALFLLSPTAFPWYYCWLLPFLCFFPRWPWITLSFLLPLNYLDFHSADSIPLAHMHVLSVPLLSLIVWGVFAIAWLIDATRSHRKATPGVLRSG